MKPRSEWSARPPTHRTVLHDPEAMDVHWEGVGVRLPSPEQVPNVIWAIQDFHMGTRKMSDIAYNFVVDPFGETWEGRGGGVKSGANGTDYSNDHYLAVCVLHGPGDPPLCPAVYDALAHLRDDYMLPLRRHSDEKPTACPGPELSAWVPLNSKPQQAPAPPPSEEDDMPYLMLRAIDGSGAIWAMFPGGVVRHIGGAEWKFYSETTKPPVPMEPVADQAEADRLKALVG